MNQQPYLTEGQDVIFIGPDKHNYKAKITTVYGPKSVRLEWENGAAIADFSEKKETGTFHFEQASPKAEHNK